MTKEEYWKKIRRTAIEIWKLGGNSGRHTGDFAMDWAYSLSARDQVDLLAASVSAPGGPQMQEQIDRLDDWERILAKMAMLAIEWDLETAIRKLEEEHGRYSEERMRKRWLPG